MHENGWKSRLIEGSAFIAVAAIAFAGGLLIGDLGASPKTETVVATSPSAEGEELKRRKPKQKAAARRPAGIHRPMWAPRSSPAPVAAVATLSKRPTQLERSAPT